MPFVFSVNGAGPAHRPRGVRGVVAASAVQEWGQSSRGWDRRLSSPQPLPTKPRHGGRDPAWRRQGWCGSSRRPSWRSSLDASASMTTALR